MRVLSYVAPLLSITMACVVAGGSAVASEETTPPTLKFFVYQSVTGRIEPMPRVTAFVVLPEAVQSVGITGEDGIVSIKKDLLGRADAAVILFCQGDKSWSCNALRLDVNRDGLMAFEELNVELAGGLQILDRQRIDPKRDGASD